MAHIRTQVVGWGDPRSASFGDESRPSQQNGSDNLQPQGQYGQMPRRMSVASSRSPLPDQIQSTGEKLHDPKVTFEEYVFWAKYARADERYEDPNHDYKLFGMTVKKSRKGDATNQLPYAPSNVAGEKSAPTAEMGRINITNEEWVTASRAVRTASWPAVFYLITTDILGPFSTPYAFAAVCFPDGE